LIKFIELFFISKGHKLKIELIEKLFYISPFGEGIRGRN